MYYKQPVGTDLGNIPACTKPIRDKTQLKPKNINLKMEKELVKYKKEIEGKFKESSIRNYNFKRKVVSIDSDFDGSLESTSVSKGSGFLPKIDSIQRNIMRNKLMDQNTIKKKILPEFSRTTRFGKLKELNNCMWLVLIFFSKNEISYSTCGQFNE